MAFLEVMSGYEGRWAVAGGWAIDFYLGCQTRSHEDLEVIVFRRDREAMFKQFRSRSPMKIVKGGDEPEFVAWDGSEIEEDVIQVRLAPLGKIDFDLLLTPSTETDWICRREESITRPFDEAIIIASNGLPILAPEIVLLFKAKHLRDKDRADFKTLRPVLDKEKSAWFEQALSKSHPGHEWLSPR